MRPQKKLIGVLVVALLVLAACQEDTSVGKDIDLRKIKGKGGRLGEASSPPPVTAGATPLSPTTTPPPPPKTQSPTPPPQQQAYVVTLTTASPYYHPGQLIQVPVGTLIRFVNKDDINRQPYVEGFFEAPPLKPGDTFDYQANVRTGGQAQIKDRIATFKVGFLEVY